MKEQPIMTLDEFKHFVNELKVYAQKNHPELKFTFNTEFLIDLSTKDLHI